jgi:hypothetical protein
MGIIEGTDEIARCAPRADRPRCWTPRGRLRAGVSTAALNQIAERALQRAGARSAFSATGRAGCRHPAVLCTSRNDIVVHGIPRQDEVLVEVIHRHRLRLLQGRLLPTRRAPLRSAW